VHPIKSFFAAGKFFDVRQSAQTDQGPSLHCSDGRRQRQFLG